MRRYVVTSFGVARLPALVLWVCAQPASAPATSSAPVAPESPQYPDYALVWQRSPPDVA